MAVLNPHANVRHAYRNVSITVTDPGNNFTLVEDELPGGDPSEGNPPVDHPRAMGGKRIYWLVAFHFNKKDTSHKPTFNIVLPVVPGRDESNFYRFQKGGQPISLGKTVQGGEPVSVELTLDDPSIGMT